MNLATKATLTLLASALAVVACGDDDDPPNPINNNSTTMNNNAGNNNAGNNNAGNNNTDPVLTSVMVTPDSVALEVGDVQALTVNGTFDDGSMSDVTADATFVSSDTDVATVDAMGTVTASTAGTAVITANVGDISDTVTITVTDLVPAIESLEIMPSPVELTTGDTQQLTVTATFDDTTTEVVTSSATYASSDTTVATVDMAGTVTASTAGTATITASIGGVSETVTVVVTAPAPTVASIAITPSPIALPVGNAQQLTVTATLDDASTEVVTSSAAFASSDSGVAAVDANGNVTALAAGVATVTAMFEGQMAAVTVTVSDPGPALVSIALTPTPIAIDAGASEQIVVTGTFADDSTSVITSSAAFSSDNTAVATVDAAGLVTAVGAGMATVTADVDGITATVMVTVTVVPPVVLTLPMVVDDNYAGRSGFSDGPDGAPIHAEDNNCPVRAGGEAGDCHRFTWDGTGGTFTGTFWTDGEAFTDLNGIRVEPGATEVSFYAWGAAGGEIIEFGAGIGDAALDGAADRLLITLTTTPTLYTVSLTNLAGYDEVFGPFIWVATAANNATGFEFFVDDIRWTSSEPPEAIPLPMVVDDNYEGRSGFSDGDGGAPLHTEDDVCPVRAGEQAGDCHHFTWNGTGGSFTGTFWTDGEGFVNLNGKRIEAGATEVSFYAWGVAGGEVIEFGAGIGANDGAEDRTVITLSTTPTMYTVPLANLANYTDVFGPFVWVATVGNNGSGVEFFVDDIQWKNTPPPEPIALPMVVDDNYTGRSGFSDGNDGAPLHAEDNACPARAGGEAGECHRFVWDGTGGTFTGTFWTDGEGFVNLNGKPVEPGAAEVSFWAWGATGGEIIEFGAGIGDANLDGAADRLIITLTTTPTRYTVPLANLAGYTNVFAPFVWVASLENNPSGAEFFVDDILWEAAQPIALPMIVDENYMGRSAFGAGPGNSQLHAEDDLCPVRGGDASGNCHRFTWDGGAEDDFTGTFWTDGNGFVGLNGPLVAPGATEVTFWAWGAGGGEVIEFGAGIGDAALDGAEVRTLITLTTTPTQYTVSLAALAGYANVFGPFIWAANNANNPTGVEFYVDSIKWEAPAVVEALPLPMTVDENYSGRSAFSDGAGGGPLHAEDNACPGRAGGEAGDCHRFTWAGTGGTFTGTFWTDGEGFADLNGPTVEPGRHRSELLRVGYSRR